MPRKNLVDYPRDSYQSTKDKEATAVPSHHLCRFCGNLRQSEFDWRDVYRSTLGYIHNSAADGCAGCRVVSLIATSYKRKDDEEVRLNKITIWGKEDMHFSVCHLKIDFMGASDKGPLDLEVFSSTRK